jgi:flagellar protein FliS
MTMNLPSAALLARYGAVKVTTCTPGQLLVMLYDGMFRFLRGAIVSMQAKDCRRAGEQIGRTLPILEQLLAGLDRKVSPDLCDKLGPLYQFCMGRITLANIRQDPKLLAEVITILTPLRDAWAAAAAQVANEAAGIQTVAATGKAGVQ